MKAHDKSYMGTCYSSLNHPFFFSFFFTFSGEDLQETIQFVHDICSTENEKFLLDYTVISVNCEQQQEKKYWHQLVQG